MLISEKHRLQKEARKALLKETNRYLLTEDDTYNGIFQNMWSGIMKSFDGFFKVVSGSVQKVSRAAVLWITINFPFTPFKTKGQYSKLFAEYERDQKANQRTIDAAMKPLEENLGGVKAAMLAFAPGAVLSAYAFEGVRGIGSDEFKGFLDNSGLTQLPVVGGAIDGLTSPGGWWFDDYKLDKETGAIEDQRGVVTKTFELIQRVFINPVGLVMGESKNILAEGEESNQEETTNDQDEQKIRRVLAELERIGAYKEIEKIGKRELTLKKNLMKQLMGPLETSYRFASVILASTDPGSFVKSLEDIKDPGIKKIDTSSIEGDFKKSLEEIKSDPKKMEELKKAAKSQGIDMETDKDADQKINEILWSVAKKDMIRVAADSVEESYKTVTEFITGDIGPEEMKMLITTDVGTEYVKFIKESMEKLDAALTDVRRLL